MRNNFFIGFIQARMNSSRLPGKVLKKIFNTSVLENIYFRFKSMEKINTYNIGFNELNEFKYAKIIANQYNTNHHQ